MSWDSYIDNLIAQTKDGNGSPHCDAACIIGLDGGAPWTTENHPNAFKVSLPPPSLPPGMVPGGLCGRI